jgi:hypothetical protein
LRREARRFSRQISVGAHGEHRTHTVFLVPQQLMSDVVVGLVRCRLRAAFCEAQVSVGIDDQRHDRLTVQIDHFR